VALEFVNISYVKEKAVLLYTGRILELILFVLGGNWIVNNAAGVYKTNNFC
jgi:hypothetical protein